MRLRVEWPDEARLDELATRWRTYEAPDEDGAPAPHLDVHVRSNPALPGIEAGDAPEAVRPEVSARGDTYIVRRKDFTATIATGGSTWRIDTETLPSSFTVENTCRIAVSLRLPREGGLLLHSSGAVRAGHALVFPAVSETGKTTMARLLGQPLLGDEMVAVRPAPDATGRVVLWGQSTPFGGEMRAVESLRAPLLALLFLEQARAHAVRDEPRASLLRRLLRNTVGFPATADDRGRYLETAAALLDAAPHVTVLAFARDPSIAAFLDAQVAAWTAGPT